MEAGEEVLIRKGQDILSGARTEVGLALGKMAATIELNHYEREIQYGYPICHRVLGQEANPRPDIHG